MDRSGLCRRVLNRAGMWEYFFPPVCPGTANRIPFIECIKSAIIPPAIRFTTEREFFA